MKKVLVIGATSAIAQEVLKIYATQNCEIAIWGRNQSLLDIIAQDLKVRGAKEVSITCHDINDISVHSELTDRIWKILNGIDIAILAHGFLGNQQVAETNQGELLNILNSNFVSHVSLMEIIAQKMKQQKAGTIATLSSVAGDRGKQSNYVYGAAKAGKTTFAAGLRNRLYEFGIHVITIKLGFVDTPMTKDFKKGALWAQSTPVAKTIVQSIDQKRDIVYIPFFWKWIMHIIKSIPEAIFKRLKL